MTEAVALTILQLVALTFTADVMLLKLMSDATAHYPDRAIRRGAIAAGMIILAGMLSALYLFYSVPLILNLSIASVILSFIATIGTLYPIARVEQAMLDSEEEVEL